MSQSRGCQSVGARVGRSWCKNQDPHVQICNGYSCMSTCSSASPRQSCQEFGVWLSADKTIYRSERKAGCKIKPKRLFKLRQNVSGAIHFAAPCRCLPYDWKCHFIWSCRILGKFLQRCCWNLYFILWVEAFAHFPTYHAMFEQLPFFLPPPLCWMGLLNRKRIKRAQDGYRRREKHKSLAIPRRMENISEGNKEYLNRTSCQIVP